MAIRTLVYYGDEIFKKPCRPVTEINDHIRLILDDLADTLNITPDCEVLAANQLGILRRLLVVKTDTGILKLVNPVIIEQSGEQDCEEACSSIRDISGTTIRPQKITVEALDETGEKITLSAEDAFALRLSHGIDHLDDKFFIEKVIRFDNKPLEGE
ncbi:MAG: peptide deformylase [Clostridiales bacterium]|nr:peptide deformylase [Clostridiales bacterium]